MPFISATYAVDAMLLPIAATSFSPALNVGLTILLTNGIYTSGTENRNPAHETGLLTLGGFYLLLDGPAPDHQLSPLPFSFIIIRFDDSIGYDAPDLEL